MTCQPFKISEGAGFICTRGRAQKPCAVCHRPFATLLCDGPVRGPVRAVGQTTCDTPLCTRCRRVFIVLEEKVDYCPLCVAAHLAAKSGTWVTT